MPTGQPGRLRRGAKESAAHCSVESGKMSLSTAPSFEDAIKEVSETHSPIVPFGCPGCSYALEKISLLEGIYNDDMDTLNDQISSLNARNQSLATQNAQQQEQITQLQHAMYRNNYRNVCADFISKIYSSVWIRIIQLDTGPVLYTTAGVGAFFDNLRYREASGEGPHHDLLDRALHDLNISTEDYNLMKRFKEARNDAQHSSMSAAEIVTFLNEKSVPVTGGYDHPEVNSAQAACPCARHLTLRDSG